MVELLVIAWAVLVLVVTAPILRGQPSPVRDLFRVLTTVVAFGPWPFAIFLSTFAGRGIARHRVWRWMFAHPQPGATLDPEGIEFRAPNIGTERFEWDEIAGMEPSIWWLRSSWASGTPDLELKMQDGRVLLRVPATIYAHVKPEGSGWRRTSPRTLAEYIVTARPDRYVLIDTQPNGRHYWFELASAAADRATTAAAVELGRLAAESTQSASSEAPAEHRRLAEPLATKLDPRLR
jgi:hypothetical protein